MSLVGDEDSWWRLWGLLQGQAEREMFLAHYARRRDWEPQEILATDLHAREENELLRWAAAATSAFPDNAEFQLLQLRFQTADDISLDQVATLAQELPEDVQLAFCHARGIAELDSEEKGAQHLADFVATYPKNPDAHQAQIELLLDLDLEDQLQAVLQRQTEIFPQEPRFRVNLLDHSPALDEAELEVKYLSLAERAVGDVERLALCMVFSAESEAGPYADQCFRHLWEDLVHRGAEGEESEALRWARDEILLYALTARDRPLAFQILDAMAGQEKAEGWHLTVEFWEADPESCLSFLQTYLSGHFEPVLESSYLDDDDWLHLFEDLTECGFKEEAEQVSRAVMPRLSAEALGRLLKRHPQTHSELQRRFKTEAPREDVIRVLYDHPNLFAEIPREKVLRILATQSKAIDLHLELFELLKQQGRIREAEGVLLDAIELAPRDLDLQLRLAGHALLQGDEGLALTWVEAIGRNRQASSRQQATGRYLLGRIARRQGRMEEASDHLEAYFLRRFEFSGCCREGVDEGFVAHLRQTAPPKRLESYLETKAKALATFAANSPPNTPFAECQKPSCPVSSAPPDKRTHIMKIMAEAGSQREDVLAWVRQQEALSNRWKKDDPETLFDDDSILGFDPAFLGHNTSEGITLRCHSGTFLNYDLLGEPYNPWSPACPW